MEISRYWRLRKQRYSMQGGVDPRTGGVSFPPGENRPVYDPHTGKLINDGRKHIRLSLETYSNITVNREH